MQSLLSSTPSPVPYNSMQAFAPPTCNPFMPPEDDCVIFEQSLLSYMNYLAFKYDDLVFLGVLETQSILVSQCSVESRHTMIHFLISSLCPLCLSALNEEIQYFHYLCNVRHVSCDPRITTSNHLHLSGLSSLAQQINSVFRKSRIKQVFIFSLFFPLGSSSYQPHPFLHQSVFQSH